jgi:hypothetical protein
VSLARAEEDSAPSTGSTNGELRRVHHRRSRTVTVVGRG